MLSKIECNLLYVMAYNGKRYDHLLMFDGVNYDVCWRQGGYLIKCVYTLGNKTVILRDLCNYVSYSNLKSIGETLGVEKFESASKHNDVLYCARDTTILALAWIKLVLQLCTPVIGVLPAFNLYLSRTIHL